jgi:hypothetical protein
LKNLKNLIQSEKYKTIMKKSCYDIFSLIMEQNFSFSIIVKMENSFKNEEDFKSLNTSFEEYSLLEFPVEYLKHISFNENKIELKIYFEQVGRVLPLSISYNDVYQILHQEEILFINLSPFFDRKVTVKDFKKISDDSDDTEVEKSIDILLSINGNDKFFKN